MSLCDRESFLEDMRTFEARYESRERDIEQAKNEFQQLLDGDISEIKYVKGDDIYEELYEQHSEELIRQENKYWGITITKGGDECVQKED